MMQIGNFFNARKIQDELNIFKGIGNNNLFILIVLIIISGQVIIVTFGGIAFGLYSNFGLQG